MKIKNIKIIGRLKITQKGYSPTTLTFFDDVVIEAQAKNKGEYVTVYKHSGKKLLTHLNFVEQFIDKNKVDEVLKDWRK